MRILVLTQLWEFVAALFGQHLVPIAFAVQVRLNPAKTLPLNALKRKPEALAPNSNPQHEMKPIIPKT